MNTSTRYSLKLRDRARPYARAGASDSQVQLAGLAGLTRSEEQCIEFRGGESVGSMP